jgi:hypothetical protein
LLHDFFLLLIAIAAMLPSLYRTAQKSQEQSAFFYKFLCARYAFEEAATVVEEKNEPSRRRARTIGL